ncbi:hypothetical protein MTO96_010500 [Rhipicephalus appendiculatus]
MAGMRTSSAGGLERVGARRDSSQRAVPCQRGVTPPPRPTALCAAAAVFYPVTTVPEGPFRGRQKPLGSVPPTSREAESVSMREGTRSLALQPCAVIALPEAGSDARK